MATNSRANPASIVCTLILVLCPSGLGKVIYVDMNAKGRNNGSSWTNASTNLDSALWGALAATKPVEVRVAGGIYKPSDSRTVGGPPDFRAEERRKA